MSLKAKIEAVIYASEEPVTLAQLIGLLGEEAQGELERGEGRQQTLQLTEGSEAGASQEAGVASKQLQQVEAPLEAEPAESSVDAGEEAAEKKTVRERERRLRDFMRATVAALVVDYATEDRGLEVREVAGGYRMATKPEYHDAVRGFVKGLKPPLKLSLQALETLAVVAYKQPVTAPEVSEIRGVDSGGVLGGLVARKLITTAGRKQVVGRPILYKTTKDFLLRFGLKDVAELPSIEEFEKMAGELAEQEEMDMVPLGSDTKEMAEERITHENLEEEKYATEPQADGDSDSLNPDDSNRPSDETPAVDGRMSGLPPTYDRPETILRRTKQPFRAGSKAMPKTDFEAPDDLNDDETGVVATPEGDNEYAPDEPLTGLPEGALQEPRGSDPDTRDDLRPRR